MLTSIVLSQFFQVQQNRFNTTSCVVPVPVQIVSIHSATTPTYIIVTRWIGNSCSCIKVGTTVAVPDIANYRIVKILQKRFIWVFWLFRLCIILETNT